MVVEATTREDERVIVQRAAEQARNLTPGEGVLSQAANEGGLLGGGGVYARTKDLVRQVTLF